VAIGNAGFAVGVGKEGSATKSLKRFFSRYFYFCMTLLMAVLAVWGFSHTVDARLLHADPPRPLLLWFQLRPSRPGSCCSSRSLL
jgi:hypothetical protein